MISHTRTVLAATLTNASSYSSGALNVGDLDTLLVSLSTTSFSGTSVAINVSAVDANGNLIKIATLNAFTNTVVAVTIGKGSEAAFNSPANVFGGFIAPGATGGYGTNLGIPYFGDQIQLDLVGSSISLSGQLSVKGK